MNCCPKCKGVSGYTYTMIVHNLMESRWDDIDAEFVDSGRTTVSLFKCIDCGTQMQEKTVIANREKQR